MHVVMTKHFRFKHSFKWKITLRITHLFIEDNQRILRSTDDLNGAFYGILQYYLNPTSNLMRVKRQY